MLVASALSDECASIVALGEKSIMGRAQQPDVHQGCLASSREGVLVMKFEIAALFTALAFFTDVRALHAVAGQYLPAHFMRNVARGRSSWRLARRPRCLRFGNRRRRCCRSCVGRLGSDPRPCGA